MARTALSRRASSRRLSGVLLAGVVALGWSASTSLSFAQSEPATTLAPESPVGTPAAVPPPQDAARASPVYTIDDLSYLLAPIALYPDPLLALVLSASTFPVQVVEAYRWISANAAAVARRDFAQLDAMALDGSVQALARFHEEITLLATHLEWSASLGMAFSLQPADVAAAVQMLRAKAEAVGNLQSTPEQVVTAREENGSSVIYITPSNPERIYVPRYDSSTVFTTLLPGALVFATGVIVGSTWNNRWGWNNRSWNQVWISPPVWHAPPSNWNPRPDRPGAGRPPGAWRPDRPGVRPERPNLRPDRPVVRPDRPIARPDVPGSRPDRPGVNRPDRPGASLPDRPNVRPDRPSVRPDRPAAGRDPGASNRPANVQRPQNVRPRPNARPQKPVARPPQYRARPQARPAPQQRARPQQQRARPQQRPGRS